MKRVNIIIETVCAALLILLFLYAAFSKWKDMGAFTHAMHNQPFPSWFATILVWALPPIEIIISTLLIFRKTQFAGFVGSLILMCLFTSYIGCILLHFFPRIPCSCGGIISKLNWQQHLVFNLCFIAVALLGIYLARKNNKPKLLPANVGT